MDYDALLSMPERLDEIVGNAGPIMNMREFAESVQDGKRPKPLMVYGPTGIGKSAAVYALAREYDWRIVELSASDYRDSETIERVLVPAANSNNIYGNRNLIVLDEIDELASRFDSGANSAIVKLINIARNPLIFVANDFWDRRISFLRNLVEPVQFRKVEVKTVSELLKKKAKHNKIAIKDEIISAIAQRSNGDVRSALNDLFVFLDSMDNQDELIYAVGQRNAKRDVFYTLDKIFLSNTLAAPLIAAANCDVDKDMLIRWIEENIAKRYKDPKDINMAFDSLSKASRFSSRATASQQYGLWRYMNVMLSSGVALAKSSYPSTSERYTFPKVVSDLSKAKAGKQKAIAIADKLQKSVHSNSREIRRSVIPLLSSIVKAADPKEDMYEFFDVAYGLKKDEVEFIKDWM